MQSSEANIGPYALQDFFLFHVLRHGIRPSKVRIPRLARMAGSRGRRMAAGLPAGPPSDLLPRRDPTVVGGLRPALLRFQPVQALGAAERPQGHRRRIALAPRRLAGAVGPQRSDVARRHPQAHPRIDRPHAHDRCSHGWTRATTRGWMARPVVVGARRADVGRRDDEGFLVRAIRMATSTGGRRNARTVGPRDSTLLATTQEKRVRDLSAPRDTLMTPDRRDLT